MATDITSYVNKIKNAVYGRDVRSSIVSAITKINDDNNKYDALKQEVITARNTTVSTSKKAIDAVNNAKSLVSQAETKNTALSSTIKSAETKNTELKASITKGETLKQDIGTAVKDAMSGDLRLVGDKRSIIFKSGVRENAAITFYKGADVGGGVVIGDGGRTIIGGGEAAQNLREALGTTAANESTEELHLANDGTVQIHTNCQTVASRKTFTFGADGALTAPAGLKGNAATATKLASARTINGQAFDGTKDIRTADSLNYVFAASGNTEKYAVFAKINKPATTTADTGVTLLISGGGNFSGAVCGSWIVELSARGQTPCMKVVEITHPSSTAPTFGYYAADNVFYFGMHSLSYRSTMGVTVLRNDAFTVGNISDESAAPAGWTAVAIAKPFTSDNGDLALSGSERHIKFSSGTRNGSPIRFFAGDVNGSGIVIGDGGRVIIGSGESANSLRDAIGGADGDEDTHVTADGKVYVYTNCNGIANRKTFTFGTDGKLNIPSGTTTGSDRRLKTDIRDIPEEQLEAFKRLSPKVFRYIGSDTPSIGLIAQDVQETALKDTLVSEGEDGMLAIDYTNLHGLEIALIQSLLAQTETMRKEIDALKKRIPDGSAKG